MQLMIKRKRVAIILPVFKVSPKNSQGKVEIRIKDNGNGNSRRCKG